MQSKSELFEQMGGRPALVKVTKIFYDKVYLHPWLKSYFENIPQDFIEEQQVDFMQMVLGGENIYVGKAPPRAHKHMFIPEELFDIRQQLLAESFQEAQTSPEMVDKWLALDESFKKLLINKSPDECEQRFRSEPILNFPKPD